MRQMFKRMIKSFSQESIDRTISGGISEQFRLLAKIILSILVTIFILILTFNIQVGSNSTIIEQLWVIYNNFIDSGNLISQTGFANRFVMAITGLLGSILLGGIFISMCSNIIERRVDTIRSGKAYYKSVSSHYVIIGYSNITVCLVKEIYKESPSSKILIMSSKESEVVRHKLQAQLNKEEERNIYIYFGNIDSLEELKRLNIKQAKEVFILGDEGDYGKDSKNIQCIHSISILKGNVLAGNELPVYVQFDKLSAFNVVQKIDIVNNFFRYPDFNSVKISKNLYFRPFNLYENWARKLWSPYAVGSEYDSLDYNPIYFLSNGNIKNADKYVHLVIVGFGNMGQALLLEAFRVCHYANYDDSINSKLRIRTIITVVDKRLKKLQDYFESQYPYLNEQVEDIRIDYIEEDITSFSIRKDLISWSEDPKQLLTIATCISDPDECISLGLNLPGEIYKSDTRVLIRQEIQTDLGLIIHRDKGRYRNVKIFGMLENCVSRNMLHDEIPAYINQEYEEKFNSKDSSKEYIKSLYYYKETGDQEQLDKEILKSRINWINLEENMRWANRYQIDAYLTFFRTLGYSIVNSLKETQNEISPEQFIKDLSDDKLLALMKMEKYRWNAERTIEGWKYGEKRDDINRVHPLIIQFNKLNEKEKFKDKQVIINLPYIMNIAGYKITTLIE